jgi:hypothetical protein
VLPPWHDGREPVTPLIQTDKPGKLKLRDEAERGPVKMKHYLHTESKAFPVSKHHDMNTYRENGGKIPYIFN